MYDMVKKVLFILLVLLVNISTSAQTNVFARMWSVYNGKPKKIVDETTGEVIQFDRSGRVTSYSMDEYEYRYYWNSDKITVASYENGKKVGEAYFEVKLNTTYEVYITFAGGYVRELYNAAGFEKESTISSNGEEIVERVYYSDEKKFSPKMVTLTVGEQSEATSFGDIAYDDYNNWIRCKKTTKGKSEISIRTIMYY